jgi:ketosteroid isomerase-like protein
MSQYEIDTLHPVFAKQMAGLSSRNLDELMDNYQPDAVLLRFDGSASGTAELREAFAAYLSLKPELVELTQYAETDDTILYRAVMNLGGELEQAFGTLVVRDGKIWRQTAGFGS